MDPHPTTPPRRRPTRVLVVHDQPLVRAALRSAIEEAEDLTVVGEAADGDHGLRLCAVLLPDVVVLDLSGPGQGQVAMTRRLAAHHPAVQTMVVTAVVDGERVRAALDAGAVGYLLDDVAPAMLRDGVRAVARGESPLDPRAVRAMLRTRPSVRVEDLTVREREVLALVARGLANKQIALELRITDSTVKAHVGSILARIGVADRTSAAAWAERHLPAAMPAELPAQLSVGTSAGGSATASAAPARTVGDVRAEWGRGRERIGRDTPARERKPAWSPGRLQPASA